MWSSGTAFAGSSPADCFRRQCLMINAARGTGRCRWTVFAHPALYCYYITDEPSAAAFPALGRLVDHLRRRVRRTWPTSICSRPMPTTISLARPAIRLLLIENTCGSTWRSRPGLVSYDHYQFANDGDLDGYFLNLAMIREVALAANVPFLNIVQACSWTPVRRVPQPDEMRYLVYTTLAYGAQESYYVYCVGAHGGHRLGGWHADRSTMP